MKVSSSLQLANYIWDVGQVGKSCQILDMQRHHCMNVTSLNMQIPTVGSLYPDFENRRRSLFVSCAHIFAQRRQICLGRRYLE